MYERDRVRDEHELASCLDRFEAPATCTLLRDVESRACRAYVTASR